MDTESPQNELLMIEIPSHCSALAHGLADFRVEEGERLRRPPGSMLRRRFLLAIALIIVLTIATATSLTLWLARDNSPKPKFKYYSMEPWGPKAVGPSSSSPDASASSALSRSERYDPATWFLQSVHGTRWTNIEDAQAQLDEIQVGMPHRISLAGKLAKCGLLGDPSAFYVRGITTEQMKRIMKAAPEVCSDMSIAGIEYPGGIWVVFSFLIDGHKPDYKRQCAAAEQVHDSGTHVSLPALVYVNGFEGMGCEPGYDYFPTIDRVNYRRAYLEWTDNAGTYCVIPNQPDDQTVKLDKLLEVANSMY